MNASSAARISVRSSVRRRRCRRSRGSARVESTSLEPARRAVDQRLQLPLDDGALDLVKVVEHEHHRLVAARRAARRSACPGPCRRCWPAVPWSAPARASARSTPSQKRGLQLSSRSSPSQATRPGTASAAHDDSSTVLPEPACAETRVTSPVVPRSISSCSLGRSHEPRRRAGGTSFAAGNGTPGRAASRGLRTGVFDGNRMHRPLGSRGCGRPVLSGWLRVFQQLPDPPRGHAGIRTACWHDAPGGRAPLRVPQLRLSSGASAR